MKTIDEMIEVMKAYKEGKEIECRNVCDDEWCDASTPVWDWHKRDYRIKHESKYLPYGSINEMLEDYKARIRNDEIFSPNVLPIIVIKGETVDFKEMFFTVGGYDFKKDRVYVNGTGWYYLNTLYLKFTYLDGSPIGKLVE